MSPHSRWRHSYLSTARSSHYHILPAPFPLQSAAGPACTNIRTPFCQSDTLGKARCRTKFTRRFWRQSFHPCSLEAPRTVRRDFITCFYESTRPIYTNVWKIYHVVMNASRVKGRYKLYVINCHNITSYNYNITSYKYITSYMIIPYTTGNVVVAKQFNVYHNSES